MAFLAGNVEAILGARVDPSGFVKYDAALARASGAAAKAEQASVGAAAGASKAGAAAAGAATSTSRFGTALGTSGAAATRFGSLVRVGIVGAVGAATAALIAAGKQAATFQAKMAELQAVTGATSQQMDAFAAAAKELGQKTGIGASAASDALIELAKGGMSATDILAGGFTGALALAQAGAMDLTAAGQALIKTLAQFGLNGTDATHVADALASAANATSMDVSDFTQALAQGGAAASAAGMSFDDTINVLAAMADRFQSGSDMGTSLKTTLTQLASPSDKATAEMKRLGIEAFDSNGKIKNAAELTQLLGDKFAQMTPKQRLHTAALIAGTDGMRTLIALAQGGTDNVIKQGSAAEVAAKKTNTLTGAWDRFKATLQNIAIDIGTPLLGPLSDGLNAVGKAIESLRKSGDIKQFFSDIGSVISTVASVIEGSGFIDYLAGIAEAIGGVVHAIASLAQGDFAGAFDGLKTAASGVAKAVSAPFRALGSLIVGPVKVAVDKILGLFTTLLGAASSTASALSFLPGVGGEFKSMSLGIDEARASIDKFRESLRDTKPVKININDVKVALGKLAGTQLEPKVMRILGDGRDAAGKVKALIALGIPPKTARLLANAAPLLAGVRTAQEAVGKLPPVRTLTINARFTGAAIIAGVQAQLNSLHAPTIRIPAAAGRLDRRASGRGPGGSELALVGEGRHRREAVVSPAGGWAYMTRGPQLAALPPDAYVIPEDPMQRGRASSLLAMLAGDLGLQGFAKGKKPSKKKPAGKKRWIPAALDPLRLPVDAVERKLADAENTETRLRNAYTKTRDLAGRKGRDGKLTKEALQARQRLAAARRDWQHAKQTARQRKKEAQEARRFQQLIEHQEAIVNRSVAEMTLADRRGDQSGYDAAAGRRGAAITERRRLLAIISSRLKALGLSGGTYAQQIAEQIAGADTDLLAPSTTGEQDRLADTGMTDQERAALANIERDAALAALTEGLDDDRSAAGRRVTLLEAVLGAASGRGLSADTVRDLAGQVKSARDNLSSFTAGSGSINDNADVQAQIEQQRARADLAERNATLNQRLWEVWGGATDIGEGRGVSITVNQSNLTGNDPRNALDAARAIVTGLGYQGGRPQARTMVG